MCSTATFLILTYIVVIFCIGSAVQFGAQSLNDIVIGRAIGGLGVGALR